MTLNREVVVVQRSPYTAIEINIGIVFVFVYF